MEASKGKSLGKGTIVRSVGMAQESVTGICARRSSLVYLESSISHPSLRRTTESYPSLCRLAGTKGSNLPHGGVESD